MIIETLNETGCFGGRIGFYRHDSETTKCPMRFSVYLPPQAGDEPLPVVTFLSGLTCTEENFMVKSGAQRVAAELGLILVSPDTSPRGDDVPDDPDGAYDFGKGAGFYVNATEEPWSTHYRMYDYITREFQDVVFDNFPGDRDRHGLAGHSMGGHGALVIGLRNMPLFRSLSAFAPITTTLHSPWGRKALRHYLGEDTDAWKQYDACEVARRVKDTSHYSKILVDQGTNDEWLEEQLKPGLLEAACTESGLPLELRRRDGYDHGYYFISTFIEDHLRFHAAELGA